MEKEETHSSKSVTREEWYGGIKPGRTENERKGAKNIATKSLTNPTAKECEVEDRVTNVR